MRPGHSGDDAGGLIGPDTASGSDVQGPGGGAADDFDRVRRGAEGRLCDADDGEAECVRGIRAEAWPAARVEGCVAIDDEEAERPVEGQDCPDARKFPLEQRTSFVWCYARDAGHVLGRHRRKGEVAADDECGCRPAHVVVVNVYGPDGRRGSEWHGPGRGQLMPSARVLSRFWATNA